MTRVGSPILFTNMVIAALLSSSVFLVEVVSFQSSGTSLSNPHIVKSLPSQIVPPRQPCYAPLFAFSDDKEDVDSSTTTLATAPSIGEKVFAELDKMRQQFSELTESLSLAKEREEQAKGDVARLTAEKNTVDAEKESFIAGKKRVLRYVFSTFTSCAHFQIISSCLTFRALHTLQRWNDRFVWSVGRCPR